MVNRLVETRDQFAWRLIKTANELGKIIRFFRKSRKLTLERVAGISNLSMRFLSELERGKETAELGKALQAVDKLGLEIIIQPRGTQQQLMQLVKKVVINDG